MIIERSLKERHMASDPKDATMFLTFDGPISTKFKSFCECYRIFSPLSEDAWIDFERISGMYTLQGDLVSWFLVAIYIAWKSSASLHAQFKFDLIMMLNETRISLFDFLNKSNKWLRMNKSEYHITAFIGKLNTSYNLSSRIFYRYCETFCTVFQFPQTISCIDVSYNKRKQRKKQVTENELFHFIWILFINARSYFPELCEDSIFLMHLLSCCFQHVFDATITNPQIKGKLLNRNFTGLPKNYNERTISSEETPRLIDTIYSYETESFTRFYVSIYEDRWKQFTLEMITRNVLKTESKDIELFLEPDVFSHNLNQLNLMYEEDHKNLDNLDERQFLASLYSDDTFNSFSSLQLKILVDSCKVYAKSTDSTSANSPFLSPSKTPSKPNSLTAIRILSRIFINPSKFKQEIHTILKTCTTETEFIESFLNDTLNILKSIPNMDFLVNNYEVLCGIYYKFVLSIVKYEKRRDSQCDLICLLTRTDFHSSIFCVAFEICIFLFQLESLAFPFSLSIHKIDAFQFFRIIELIIRSEPNLSRNIVQYFNSLEESIISYYAWNKNSTIFKLIQNNKNIVPTLADVSFPSFIDRTPNAEAASRKTATPSNINSASKTDGFSVFNLFQDKDRLKKLHSVTRNLFKPSNKNTPDKSNPANSPKIVASPNTPIITLTQTMDLNGNTVEETIHHNINQDLNLLSISSSIPSCPPCRLIDTPADNSSNESPSQSHKSATPLIFFMRKVYHLATSRLKSLCDFFKMEEDMRSRCWTFLEMIITRSIRLLEDHYLEQIIMCSVFVLGRTTDNSWAFNEILKWYRNQPYFNPQVYMTVKISCGQPPSDDKPSEGVDEAKEAVKCGDLIEYYNKIFLSAINGYVQKLNSSKQEGSNKLVFSPLPHINGVKSYNSQKLSVNTSSCVYVSPKKSIANEGSLGFKEVYTFKTSPMPPAKIYDGPLSQGNSPYNGKRRVGNLDDNPIDNTLFCYSPIKMSKS